MNLNPILETDCYKLTHHMMLPKNTEMIYSNLTPRSSRMQGVDKMVFFGLQYFIKEYLIERFNRHFFNVPEWMIISEYKRAIDAIFGKDIITVEHIRDLHRLGYLPIKIKALSEGSLVPMRVPCLTIVNTDKRFAWLTNYLESIISNVLWFPCTSATTSLRYKKICNKYANDTCDSDDHVKFQSHDFSKRGQSSPESALTSGAAFLTSFCGTDSVPAISFVEDYYNANIEQELIGCSVPASEHALTTLGSAYNSEYETFDRLAFDIFPNGILSLVSDSYDYFKILTEYLPSRKEKILSRNGKVVIRPDSSPKTPLEIVCGDPESKNEAERKGSIQLLWEIFGGSINSRGYKELDSHIGLIYGEAILPELFINILETLKQQRFASNNLVVGVGSYSFVGRVTRDSLNLAIKCTAGQVDGKLYEVYKDPKTDSGTKKSAKGLLFVGRDPITNEFYLEDQVDWNKESQGELRTVFEDGKLLIDEKFSTIRSRLNG